MKCSGKQIYRDREKINGCLGLGMGIGSDCKYAQGVSWRDGNVLKLSCDDDHNCVNLLIAQLVKNLPAMQESLVWFLGWEDPLEKGKATYPSVILGFPCGSAGKESTCNVGDLGSISGLGRSPGEGKGYPLQDSGLENSMDCTVHGVAKSWTRLSDFHLHFHWTVPLNWLNFTNL